MDPKWSAQPGPNTHVASVTEVDEWNAACISGVVHSTGRKVYDWSHFDPPGTHGAHLGNLKTEASSDSVTIGFASAAFAILTVCAIVSHMPI